MRQTKKYARSTFQCHSFGLQGAPKGQTLPKKHKNIISSPVKSPQDQTAKKKFESDTDKIIKLKNKFLFLAYLSFIP